ncbi:MULTISPECIES: hypothetical protein [Devosia]|uniref:hypothetical protein n=1 Tax=Devosia TaxID=46913 RepID=UPI000CE95473|nr:MULTISPECIES: hypothetical protein [Devosia]AVF03605.1 hypothetical protein C4375_07630 [Devosia sp. I507]
MTQKKPATIAKTPDFIAWSVVKNGEKSHWNRIGAAWSHGDQKGFNVTLETLPIDGKIVLRLASESKEQGA